MISDEENLMAQTLKYDIAVLEERRSLLWCLWGKASLVCRHDWAAVGADI